MNWKKKEGFTLVELMVVAIIVAILAAVAIPLMMGNKNRAIATEAQAGLGTIRTALQVWKAEHGAFPNTAAIHPHDWVENGQKLTIKEGDLSGKYFLDTDYSFTSTPSNYTATATGSTNDAVGITITLDEGGNWTGIP